VIVPAVAWPDAFDALVDWRRSVSNRFGVPTRAEIKANWLITSKGTFKTHPLEPWKRRLIYRESLQLAPTTGMRVFAVVINKDKMRRDQTESIDWAWSFLLQRLERFSNQEGPVVIIHDEGENARIRAISRRARRAAIAGNAFGPGVLSVPMRLLIDDPVVRVSRESYLIQMADLVAYAAFRKLNPGSHPDPVCENNVWDRLGTAVLTEATGLKDARVSGIVEWPL
jgi:hypothetical protein